VTAVLGYGLAALVLTAWVGSLVARHRIARDRRTDQGRRRAADRYARSVTEMATEWGKQWALDLAAVQHAQDFTRSVRDGFVQIATWDDKPVSRLPEPSKEAS
jgi:hypothetical protein